ncbi:TetR/AcrR family transcriptional regulator [Cyclobacterium salsum]|uniref:TetR/AcrR family transcriptional regulator n=1 Tax=Cyclobacterium salsum TaxID=2666329 RepID=UPI001391C232|nr:TetR/AcrR family transcriptional regulator [Cyclobacterium salsum]
MPRIKSFDETETLERAMELFWKKGYHSTSVQDLVDHLGINRASLYDTYKGKKDLFMRAFENYRETTKNTYYELLYAQPNVMEGFRKLFEHVVRENTDRRGCFLVNITTELVPEDSEMKAMLRENQIQFEKLFFDYLKSGEVMGEIARGKDLKAFANLLFTLYNGVQVISKIESAPSRQLAAVEVVLQLLED